MGKTRKLADLVNVVVTDMQNNVTLPKALTIGEVPAIDDDSFKVPTTSWVNDKLVGSNIPAGGTTGQLLGKQSNTNYDFTWFDPSSPASFASVLKHTVKAGEALTKGQAVYVSSADGTNIIVSKASNTTEQASSKTMGLIAQNLANNGIGEVVTEGLLAGLNTSTALAGDPVWLGVNGNLIFGLTNKPYAPNHLVFIGIVTRVNTNNGEIFVKVQNGFELQEIHNVDLKTNAPVNGELLGFNGALWVNKTIAGWLGYTPANAAAYVPYTGATTNVNLGSNSITANSFIKSGGTSSQFLKADGSVDSSIYSTTTGTVTSVAALTLGTSGTDLSSTVATGTTTPVITLNVPTASATNRGALSSGDWILFNGKQAQLNGTGFVKANGTTITYDNSSYLTSISGITAGGELSGTYPNPTLVNSAVTGKLLTGVNITGGSIAATDSILTAFGKVQNQINSLVGGVNYQGTWNASTNLPALTSSVGTKGYYYVVTTAGTTSLNGINDWKLGDWVIFNGTTWDKVDNTDSVISVNGFTGAVSLTTDNISEGSTNLYYTNARVRGAIGLTTSGSSGVATYTASTGVLNIPTYTLAGLGGQPLLTNPTTGTGTTNYVTKWTGTSALGNSQIFDNGTNVGIGTASPTTKTQITTNLGGTNPSTYTDVLTIGVSNGQNETVKPNIGSSLVFRGIEYYNQEFALARIAAQKTLADWNGFLTFHTNPGNQDGTTTERLRITSAGNVGIGTASPAEKLSVAGNIYQTGDTYRIKNNSSNVSYIRAEENTTTAAYTYVTMDGRSTGYYAISTNDIERMRITSTGNVGIGTASPTTKLHVLANSAADEGNAAVIIRQGGGNNNNGLLVDVTNSVNAYIADFRQANSSLMRLTGAGNLGIGTTSPADKLEVAGVARFTGSGGRSVVVNGTSNGRIDINGDGSTYATGILFNSQLGGTALSGIWNFGSGTSQQWLALGGTAYNTSAMYILPSGNVGIGTTSPTYKLDVNGNVRVTGTMTATLGGFNSDINDKKDLIYGAKSNVLDLNAVSYLRKSTNNKEYGYIAQDVKKVLPEAVYETVSGLAVSYHMVNAAKIQALQEEIKELKAKLLSK
jgi:hypothetical protein